VSLVLCCALALCVIPTAFDGYMVHLAFLLSKHGVLFVFERTTCYTMPRICDAGSRESAWLCSRYQVPALDRFLSSSTTLRTSARQASSSFRTSRLDLKRRSGNLARIRVHSNIHTQTRKRSPYDSTREVEILSNHDCQQNVPSSNFLPKEDPSPK
jgi:hypothetical protein